MITYVVSHNYTIHELKHSNNDQESHKNINEHSPLWGRIQIILPYWRSNLLRSVVTIVRFGGGLDRCRDGVGGCCGGLGGRGRGSGIASVGTFWCHCELCEFDADKSYLKTTFMKDHRAGVAEPQCSRIESRWPDLLFFLFSGSCCEGPRSFNLEPRVTNARSDQALFYVPVPAPPHTYFVNNYGSLLRTIKCTYRNIYLEICTNISNPNMVGSNKVVRIAVIVWLLLYKKGIETAAYILGAITAGGGTFGFVKTGSVPSIAAGLTVGTLVDALEKTISPFVLLTFTVFVGRVPHPDRPEVRRGAGSPCFDRPCWILYSKSYQRSETSTHGIEPDLPLWTMDFR